MRCCCPARSVRPGTSRPGTHIRGILASAAAVATVTAAAFATPAAAAVPHPMAMGSTTGTTSALDVHTAFSKNLHAEFAQLRAHTTTAPRAGIVPPLTKHSTGEPSAKPAARLAGPCTEPNCNLVYNGARNRIWTRSGSQYVNRASGKCLTDPGNSRANGTQLTLATCANKVYQRWTLP